MEEKNKYRSVISRTMMIVSVIVIVVFMPLVFINGNIFEKFLISIGVKNSPNINDGYPIAEFYDQSGDLLLSFPQNSLYQNAKNALDIRKFSIKKVEFSSLSGMGIDARLNLCFEFEGKQPNPLEFKNRFSFPVLHVYIKSPKTDINQNNSDKSAKVNFHEGGWNYQVIIDGAHEQARVYNNNGEYLASGLGLYVNYEYEKGHNWKQDYITKTNITAGIPLKLLVDPEQGEWKYYVISGLLDVKELSMLYRSGKDSSDVFDYIASDTITRPEFDTSGKISLHPLTVNYQQSQK